MKRITKYVTSLFAAFLIVAAAIVSANQNAAAQQSPNVDDPALTPFPYTLTVPCWETQNFFKWVKQSDLHLVLTMGRLPYDIDGGILIKFPTERGQLPAFFNFSVVTVVVDREKTETIEIVCLTDSFKSLNFVEKFLHEYIFRSERL